MTNWILSNNYQVPTSQRKIMASKHFSKSEKSFLKSSMMLLENKSYRAKNSLHSFGDLLLLWWKSQRCTQQHNKNNKRKRLNISRQMTGIPAIMRNKWISANTTQNVEPKCVIWENFRVERWNSKNVPLDGRGWLHKKKWLLGQNGGTAAGPETEKRGHFCQNSWHF